MEKIRVTVRVAGKEYTMASYDSEEYVRRVAAYVDKKFMETSISTRLPAQDVSNLVAISICDDMLKAQDEVRKLRIELGEMRGIIEKNEEQR